MYAVWLLVTHLHKYPYHYNPIARVNGLCVVPVDVSVVSQNLDLEIGKTKWKTSIVNIVWI